MIKKILLILIPSVLMAICLYFSIRAYQKYSENYVDVYVASHQISQRTLISEKDLTVLKVPKEFINEDVYAKKESILGKYVRLSYSIPKGSLFYKTALETDIKDLAYTLLLKGQASYDIYTNEVKVNTGNLNTGMYVDLYLTINTNEKPVSDLLLEYCRIIGLYDANGKQILNYDKESRVGIMSLAVDRNDVSIINKAMTVGELRIVASPGTYSTDLLSRLNSSSALFDYLQ
ncbi:MAG: hypothetical protein J5365_04350 [Erysipelotrichaceae bacterium]|nr:hypothetical protein [Erysipelotrichaceae bacterium]